ncbi:MAG TPA: 2-oxoglutarate dehydrogenase E1 component [Longimicrobiales bacterium]|nr:2-oxoglutarate dehydrogenase E1 component [Longimicrobiales bacterium]
MSDPIFDQQNAAYVQMLYEEYARNPESVPEVWRDFFGRGPDDARAAGLLLPEGLEANGGPPVPAAAPPVSTSAAATHEPAAAPESDAEAQRLRALLPAVARAASFVQAYRDHGHAMAQIDPLGSSPPGHPQLDPGFFGTSMEELEQVPASVVMDGARADESVADALRRLQKSYVGYIGFEFEHIEDPARVRWLWAQVESGFHTAPLEADTKRWLLERLSEVEGLEQFLHRAYLGQKRFSVEGTDMMVPMLDVAIREAAARGGRRVVLGMAHRGRLNVLAHILQVPYEALLAEFEGVKLPSAFQVPGSGDVKYHHGAEAQYSLNDGDPVQVTLAPNPSHLEFVDPVVMGMARAWQFDGNGTGESADPDVVVPILIHGDAAFAAEGVVAESLNMSRLTGYAVGGTVHIIANNQIGFTTDPEEGRSTRYASDLAKGFDIPVLHVNGDRPEACIAAVRLAMAYREEYHDDVVIDLVGYRRHGHNEGDEPAYTQPELYSRIHDHPTVRTQWADRLAEDGVVTREEADAIQERVLERFRAAQDTVKSGEAPKLFEERPKAPDLVVPDHTGVDLETLRRVNDASVSVPEGFTIHPKLARQLSKRTEAFDESSTLDWAHGEALAFGSLLLEDYAVRLSGQDAKRGTFSQRHLVLHDVETGATVTPLASLGGGRLEVFNSPLTETAVMGFEYGYSVATQRDLVLWEGQFGDFVNVAQVVIDQFIAAGREKWGQFSNLTLLLPHGMEGQGPEHSSARLERFLQLCAEGNMRVTYPTTPAQYFHLLRRQAHSSPERPLIVMTPKSLLRLPAAASTVAELTEGTFRPVVEDPGATERRDEVKRLVLCSGKVYYDLQGLDRRNDAADTAVARLEELYPFPKDQLAELLSAYPALEEVVWAQEEPRNMGGLTYVGPRLRAVVPRHIPLRQVSRPDRASPAEGSAKDHVREQARIVHEALGLEQQG